MINYYLMVLVTAHLIGAVYCQNEERRASVATVFYLLPFVALGWFLPVANWGFLLASLVALFVVYRGSLWVKATGKLGQRQRLLLSFLGFGGLLVFLAFQLTAKTDAVDVQLWHAFFNSKNGQLVKFACLSVWLFKPANVTFKLAFAKYQYSARQGPATWPLLQTRPSTVEGAGAVIGNLERLMMALFLVLSKYAAIGLILTAKSITRYNKITTDPAFSEYYLIGTLYSLLATLIPYVLLFQFV